MYFDHGDIFRVEPLAVDARLPCACGDAYRDVEMMVYTVLLHIV